jgi:ubiquinone biosynthesis protein Coq4
MRRPVAGQARGCFCSLLRQTNKNHTPLSAIQSALSTRTGAVRAQSTSRVQLAIEAALTAFRDPLRDDAVAALGELTGEPALRAIRDRMLADDAGRRIVQERWLISEESIHVSALRELPVGTFGRCYANFLLTHGFSPDERKPVRYIADPELAFVMQRYVRTWPQGAGRRALACAWRGCCVC